MNKYKNDIEQHLISNSHRDNESYGHLHSELDEVYRKSQAFDRIENYLADQQAYDWDDEYTLTLVAEEVEKVVMEE